MGYGLEVDAIRIAHELDLLTAPYVFWDDDADGDGRGGRGRARAAHGADDRRHDRRRHRQALDDCVPLIQGMHDAANASTPT